MVSDIVIAAYVAKKILPNLECDNCGAELVEDDDTIEWTGDGIRKLYAENGISGVFARQPEMSHENRIELMAKNGNVTVDGDKIKCKVCGSVEMEPSDYE